MDGASLEFRMLGELDVRRNGRTLPQPPSKKTRALLAYLVLTTRSHRREALCSLLWDVTDDPRGALRWSLSKLRKQVDDAGAKRITTDRERVGFELHGATVDVLQMRQDLGQGKLREASTECLEAWCGRCAGEVLEGLDLPDFDTYQAWLVAEREQIRKLRAAILQELVERLQSAPELALPHARTWVQVDPMSAPARLAVMRLALAAGQRDEAKRQYQMARRVFSELDPAKERQLTADWHTLRTAGSEAFQEALVESEPAPRPTRELSLKLAAAPALVGREAERQRMRDSLAEVTRKRRARVVLLVGEPGIGKSRLVDELIYASRKAGNAVLDGTAFEGESGRPYGPWIDALRKLPQARFGASAREKLTPLLAGTADIRTHSREGLFSGVIEVLTALSASHAPVLVALDDAQWLDEGSAELLHYAARMQRDQPVLFVLTARDAELHDQQVLLRILRSLRRDMKVEEVALAPLDESATTELVHAVDTNADAEQVFTQSGGNPLFALELARAGTTPERVSTVAEAVRDRVERLHPEAGEVLRWGAVVGPAIDTRQLARLSSLSAEQQLLALEELERHALVQLEPEHGYVFTHEVVRRVVYADLSQPRRTLMHRRAAEALRALQSEQSGSVDEAVIADVARHAALAEDHALAASAYVAAGKRCLKLFASANAASLARRGLRHARRLPERERAQTTLELLDVELWARRPADPEAFCEEVHQLADLALHHGCVEHARLGYNMLSYVRWEVGEWNEARKQSLKAARVVRSAEGADHVEALADAARCLALLERDMGHAEALAAEAQARAKQLDYESAALHEALGLLKVHRGESEDAEVLFERSQTMAQATSHRYGEIQTRMNRFALLFEDGRYREARELACETEQLAEKTRGGSEGPFARVMRALAELALEEAQALPHLHRALEDLRIADAKHRLAYGLTRAAVLLLERGQPGEALPLAEEGLEIGRFLERPSEIGLALAALAKAQRDLGDHEASVQCRQQLDRAGGAKLSAYAARVRERLLEG